MTSLRGVVASLGVALAGLGVLLVAAPGLAGALPLPRLAVVVLGLFALVEAVRSVQARRRATPEAAVLPEPEPRYEAPRPGDAFDERLATIARRPRRTWAGGEHEAVRRRLRSAAVEAAAHRFRLPTPAARRRVDAGTWTDDPAAAAFLGGPDAPGPPWGVRLRATLSGSAFAFYARRTADAVVALREAP